MSTTLNRLVYSSTATPNPSSTESAFGSHRKLRGWIDYNPSDAFHWIYDRLLTRDDVTYIQSTYKDNPFLDASIVAEIERLATTDEDYWRIYGLGERGMSRATIFQFGMNDSEYEDESDMEEEDEMEDEED